MIRHVVICQFAPDAKPADIERFLLEIANVRTPGMRSSTYGLDLGLRDGTDSYALVADFDDAEAFHRYDNDPEHARIRASITHFVVGVSRVQFEVPE